MTTKTDNYVCRLDADGWQLYTFDAEEIEAGKPDSEASAREISAALTLAVREAKARLKADPCLSEKKLARKIRDEIYKVMDKHSKAGARDTEPEGVLVSELETAFGLEDYSLER